MILLFSLLLTNANAGLWSKICERMIADDPYEFETAPDEWVKREIERLQIRSNWNTLNASDQSRLRILEREVQKREAIAEIINGPEATRDRNEVERVHRTDRPTAEGFSLGSTSQRVGLDPDQAE